LERRNASSSGEKIRTATVPGQTLERGKGRNQVAASIKEQNCDRQINKIYRDKMVAYLSSFYGTAAAIHLIFAEFLSAAVSSCVFRSAKRLERLESSPL